ncbi:hypothetical protein [Amphritea sp.]|uniref:hypothetical protein n=1 Tax=Amphritea sp. TaxID=1872502 RepID=UPI0025C66960|nr:hypothetical protein [Amphritea sp.]
MDYEEQIEVPTNYIAAVIRYKVHLIVAVVLLSLISIVVVTAIPAVYRSESIVLVETQQIPTDLVRSTVTSLAAEQIQIIKQRVMTRERLMEIADKFPSLKEASGTVLVSKLVEDLREDIAVELITGSKTSRNRTATTIAFKVSFDALSPTVAQAVANDLVTLFLDENAKARTERATETTDFLQSEANKLQQQLNNTEQAIADYKLQNKDGLPEHLNLYMTMLERAQTTQVELQRQIESERNQRSLYELQGGSAKGVGTLSRLAELEADYERLSTIYHATHPDLISLKSEISQLSNVSRKNDSGIRSGNSLLSGKIAGSNAKILSMRKQMAKNGEQITELEGKIIKIPQVERGLLALNRDYRTVRDQYEQIVGNTMQARMAESLEQGRKAERFSILEPPLLPDQPYKPDRKKFLGAGLVMSLGLPLAIVLLIAFLDKSVRGASAVEVITNQAPLVVISYIETADEKRKKKKKFIVLMGLIVALFVLGVLAFHTIVMPLDFLIYKLMSKFGLS